MTLRSPRARQEGMVLGALVGALLFLFSLAAGLSMVTATHMRASRESEARLRAFYLADSGAQIGNALVQSSGGSLPYQSFTETLPGGTALVTIDPLGGGIFEIQSTGDFVGIQETVELSLQLTSTFGLSGAVELAFDDGVEVGAPGIPVSLLGTSLVSGQDHAADGTLLADQSGAVYGLSTHSVPGGSGFDVTLDPGAVLAGSPDPHGNQSADQSALFQALRDLAVSSADVFMSGGRTLDDDDTGAFGTAASPVLVYVDLGVESTLTLEGGFEGHGTLLIDVAEADVTTALHLRGTSFWHGPIIVQLRGEAEVEGGALVRFEDSAQILGGLALHFRGDGVAVEDAGKVIQMSGSSAIRYSEALVAGAPGSGAVSSATLSVLAYRRL